MSRISNLTKYPYDYNITDKDFVIGTDGDNKKTKNFPVVALAEYVRDFNNNLSYDRVISIGDITLENDNITINVNDLGNVVYINNTFYIKNTPDTFTFTPVTEGVKIILLYALPDEQIFYMLEGTQSIETIEPILPSGALFVQRIIVTVNGIEIIPNVGIISDEKVQITEATNFAQIGQTQKDFNKNIADEVISLTDVIEETKTEVNSNLATKLDKGTYTGTASDLKNEIDNKANISHTHNISDVDNLQTALDKINNDINNLEGINYTWSPTNRTLTLFDNNGTQLSQVSLVSLDNEGTDIRYNASTLSLELYNADNELLDSIPVSSFIGSVGTQLQLNSNQLQLKDSQGNILSTVSFTISNVNGLQVALDNKLNKPTSTGNTTSHPFVVGEDGNGNSARLPAGDLGKNFFNSDLSNTTARNHTMNAGVTINTLGNPYSLTGLPNKNADIANFRKVRVQNASGLDAVVDSKNMLLDMPSYLTEQERNAWKTSMNGGWTTNTMSIYAILPPIIKYENNVSEFILRGANLNINPASLRIEILSVQSTPANPIVLKIINNSQVTLDNVDGTILRFYENVFDLGLGEFKIGIWNGAAYYVSSITFKVTNSINNVDLSMLTWDVIKSPEFDVSPNGIVTNAGSINYSNTTTNTVEGTSPQVSAKSSKIFNVGENWYIKFNYALSWSSSTNYISSIPTNFGLIKTNVNNSLVFQIDNTIDNTFTQDSGTQRTLVNFRGENFSSNRPSTSIEVIMIKNNTSITVVILNNSSNAKSILKTFSITTTTDSDFSFIFQAPNRKMPSAAINARETTIVNIQEAYTF